MTKRGKIGIEPYEGLWDFDGSCAPNEDGTWAMFVSQERFSLGIFRWERRARGKKLKRGLIEKRVHGMVADPGPAYAEARAICRAWNAQDGGGHD